MDTGRRTALLVAAAIFMENLDGTIIASAAPAMGRSLGVAAVDINVVATAYLLTVAVLIPISGWIADRFGARRVFCCAIVLFTAASGLCAISTTLTELTVMRVLQGAGGALMIPVGRLVVLRITPKEGIIAAIAYLTWPGLLALVLAPALGGIIVQHASWPWIFLINLPLGLIALPLALRHIPAIAAPDPGRLDWIGFVLVGAALACIMIGLEAVGAQHPDAVWITVTAALGVVLIILAVIHLRRKGRDRPPLLDLSVLRIHTFALAQTGGSLFRIAISAVPFLVPLMLQEGFGWSPSKAGVVTLAIFVGNLCIKPATTPLLRRLGFRGVLLLNSTLAVITLIVIGLLGAGTPLWVTVLVLALSGVFRSINFTAYNTITFADVPPHQTAAANTLATTLFQISVSMGVAAAALGIRLGQPLSGLLGLSGPVAAYHVAFVLIALLIVPSVIEAFWLRPDAGWGLFVPEPEAEPEPA